MNEARKNDICMRYRQAKYPDRQIQILAELNSMSKVEVIGILIGNGEKIQRRTVNQLHKKMETLKKKIAAAEEEYKENAANADYSRYNRLDRLNAEIVRYERQYREIKEALGIDKKKRGGRGVYGRIYSNGHAEPAEPAKQGRH